MTCRGFCHSKLTFISMLKMSSALPISPFRDSSRLADQSGSYHMWFKRTGKMAIF
jgi:hypothetical protein